MSTVLFKKYHPEPMMRPKPRGLGPHSHNKAEERMTMKSEGANSLVTSVEP
jgi:hypothetical protein